MPGGNNSKGSGGNSSKDPTLCHGGSSTSLHLEKDPGLCRSNPSFHVHCSCQSSLDSSIQYLPRKFEKKNSYYIPTLKITHVEKFAPWSMPISWCLFPVIFSCLAYHHLQWPQWLQSLWCYVARLQRHWCQTVGSAGLPATGEVPKGQCDTDQSEELPLFRSFLAATRSVWDAPVSGTSLVWDFSCRQRPQFSTFVLCRSTDPMFPMFRINFLFHQQNYQPNSVTPSKKNLVECFAMVTPQF